MKALVFAVLSLFVVQAEASGCLGGDWRRVSKEALAPTEIRTDYYGSPKTEVDIFGSMAYVTWTITTPTKEKLVFRSGMFSLAKINLVNLLTRLSEFKPTVIAGTVKTVEVNEYYDDCSDIPENTRMTSLDYTVLVDVGGGAVQSMDAHQVSYDPPLQR